MKIMAINGSPKTEGSVSQMIIDQLAKLSDNKIPTFPAKSFLNDVNSEDKVNTLLKQDVLLVVFPLYVDSLPAPLIDVLLKIQANITNTKELPLVYAVCNCGLYESQHNSLALNMIEHFCEESGLSWGGGLGIGHGGMLESMGQNWSKGPAAAVYKALTVFAEAISKKTAFANYYASASFPRFLYIISANLGWHYLAFKNKVHGKIKAKPYT